MDITFNCSSCGQHIVIDDAGGGLTVNCPKCGKPLTVPKVGAQSYPEHPASKNTFPWRRIFGMSAVVVVWAFAAFVLAITSVLTTAVTSAVVVLAIATAVALKRKRRIGPIIGVCGLALVILLILVVNFSSSPSDIAHNLGHDEGYADADSRLPELSGYQLVERARNTAISNKVEDITPAWTDRFKEGYKSGYDFRSSPYGVGYHAGYTQSRSGYVKPNADVLDAMARRAYDGVGWTDMYKEGYKTGWKAAGGAW